MKANELRIGNFVKGKEMNVYWTVEAIDGNSIFSYGKWRSLDAFEPIPLNEEFLLKFGFEEEEGWFKKKRLLLFNIRNMYFTTPSRDIVSVDVTAVHQLQNLYHALTGEELTLKNQEK